MSVSSGCSSGRDVLRCSFVAEEAFFYPPLFPAKGTHLCPITDEAYRISPAALRTKVDVLCLAVASLSMAMDTALELRNPTLSQSGT